MYFWRKSAEPSWLKAHEEVLQKCANGRLVVVHRPGRKRLELEIVFRSRSDSEALLKEFGGRVEALPRNWLERFARTDSKPIKIGKRLMIVRSINELQRCSARCPQRNSEQCARADARTAQSTAHSVEARLLVIAASLAFGTGEHATTATSLRLLEQLTRDWKPGWSVVDLGTGSGILALAAKRFGAGQAAGIDKDPAAISVAKSNAALNKIRRVRFQLGDVRKFNPAQQTDVITANLYCDLLMEILPKLRFGGWLILSGILRSQEDELTHVLQQNQYDIVRVKRRGKWVAILARRTGTYGHQIWSRQILRWS